MKDDIINIVYDKWFHSVGQGLFYSLSLNTYHNKEQTSNEYNIVFDCGSENVDNIRKAVSFFKPTIKKINLLVISHLHFDHVSGLRYILENNTKVDTIILPYLYPFERLSLILSNVETPKWYKSFLGDPSDFLAKYKNIKNIEYIVSNDLNDNNYNNNIEYEEKFYEKDDLYNNLKRISKDHLDYLLNIENSKNKSKINYKTHYGFLRIGSLLYIKIFNYSIKTKKLNTFRKNISKNKILEIIRNLSDLTKYQSIYKSIHTDLNVTSLSLFHTLIPNHKAKVRIFPQNSMFLNFNHLYNDYYYIYYKDRRLKYAERLFGTLLLGDIRLDFKRKSEEFFSYFKNDFKDIKFVQLSHHGAINGWNDKLLDNIKNAYYIASVGKKNNFSHPDNTVIMDILNSRNHLDIVNELKHFRVTADIDIY